MSTFKKSCNTIVILGVIFGLLVPILSLPTTDVPSTTTDASSTTIEDSSSSQESDEMTPPRPQRDVNEDTGDVPSTTPSIVLQPNVTGALDVGQGLLVPLVPVIDPNANTDAPSPPSTLKASLLPVAVEQVTEPTDEPKPEVRRRSLEDMDVAEDIIFRPLFRYRQQARQQYTSSRSYQPYIYAYRKPNYNYDY